MSQLDPKLVGEFIDAAVESPERARQLLREHPDLLESRWLHGETPLHFLAVENYATGVRFLAELGANVNATNEFGDTPLIDVATLGNDNIAEILLSFGADPNATSNTRDNVLHCAAMSGNARLVCRLIEAGANPHYCTVIGQTILDSLPSEPNARQAILAVLRKHGLDPDAA